MKRMVRRTLILGAIAAAIVASACRGTANQAEAPGRPNVLVVLLDDLTVTADLTATSPSFTLCARIRAS